jgi:uncharacterized protein
VTNGSGNYDFAMQTHDPSIERLGVEGVRATIRGFADAVRTHAATINRLNVYPVPDGDTGTNMSRTLDAVVAEMDGASVDSADMGETCKAISHGSLMGARGNSGVILSQILRGMVGVLSATKEATAPVVAEALSAASAAAYKAVGKPIEGTILTVVREAADAARISAAAGASLRDMLAEARRAAKAALDSTPDLLPVLKDAGVVDAGGAGFLFLLDSALHVVDGTPMPVPDYPEGIAVDPTSANAVAAAGGIADLRYEVMYFLDLLDDRIDDFKDRWGQIGDSIVVVGGDGLWNCHVHTNDVGAAIEVALDLDGRPRKIRVTDLFEEVAAEHAAREAAIAGVSHASTAGLPAVTTAVVAVSSGSGLTELFGQLGVQGVVGGGQTANPSTAELLAAVEAVNAQQVVVLPNNKNIIPVAEQLQGLTTKTVVVVPTRSMPEALAALIVYDPEDAADVNAASMAASAESVATGEVTQAVRDTASDAGAIREGDWIGIMRGDGIVSVGGSVVAACEKLLDHLLSAEHEILTIVTGSDAKPKTTDELVAWLGTQYPDVEVEIHRGGQPLYPYLFGAE